MTSVKKFLNINSLKSQPLFVNMMSLGLLQMANYIIPILIIPFVVRALGVEFFGKASYAQNIISYLTLIVTYGFEYSATQDVAINREDKSKLRTVFWTVVNFKALLLAVSLAVLVVLYFTFPKAGEDPMLYFYAALLNVGMVLFPTWFFQGIEKMKNMAIFNFAIKALGAVLVVLLVRAPTDYRTYILLLSMSYVLVGIISFIYVIKKYDLIVGHTIMQFHPHGDASIYEALVGLGQKNIVIDTQKAEKNTDRELSRKVISKGFPIFLNNVFVSLYAVVGITIIGIYQTDYDVGIYSGAYRIILAVIMLTTMPISYSLFPVMSRKFNESKSEGWRFFKKSFVIILVLSIFICLFVFIISPFVVRIFLGNDFNESISVLRFMSVIPSLVIVATILTVQGLYALQLQRYSPFVGFFAGLTGLMANLVFVPLFGIYGAVWAWISAEIVEIVIVGAIVLKYKRQNI
jgi:PST family polysaccharide transporter